MAAVMALWRRLGWSLGVSLFAAVDGLVSICTADGKRSWRYPGEPAGYYKSDEGVVASWDNVRLDGGEREFGCVYLHILVMEGTWMES